MARIVRSAVIQTKFEGSGDEPLEKIKKDMTDKAVAQIEEAAGKGAHIACLQEIFYGPYFCCEQKKRWYDATERIPDGSTTKLMMDLAKRLGIALVVPIYEEDQTGHYYNTAAVIDNDGSYLGKFRKIHIPHVEPGFWEKFYFRPGNMGFPVFKTKVATVGVYICYDRHFPEGWRALGLAGAEIVYNPSATVAGLSEYLWKLEQPAAACANAYYVGAINRPGFEKPWDMGEFYGQSYHCDPRGKILDIGPRDQSAVVISDLDMDLIREVRNTWQFYRDRRPETYDSIVAP